MNSDQIHVRFSEKPGFLVVPFVTESLIGNLHIDENFIDILDESGRMILSFSRESIMQISFFTKSMTLKTVSGDSYYFLIDQLPEFMTKYRKNILDSRMIYKGDIRAIKHVQDKLQYYGYPFQSKDFIDLSYLYYAQRTLVVIVPTVLICVLVLIFTLNFFVDRAGPDVSPTADESIKNPNAVTNQRPVVSTTTLPGYDPNMRTIPSEESEYEIKDFESFPGDLFTDSQEVDSQYVRVQGKITNLSIRVKSYHIKISCETDYGEVVEVSDELHDVKPQEEQWFSAGFNLEKETKSVDCEITRVGKRL